MSGVELSKENYQKLLDAERGLTDIVSHLDKAEKCGIDCQNYRATLRNQLAEIANMKANFAPKSMQQGY
jgi:hypothetical protein